MKISSIAQESPKTEKARRKLEARIAKVEGEVNPEALANSKAKIDLALARTEGRTVVSGSFGTKETAEPSTFVQNMLKTLQEEHVNPSLQNRVTQKQ